jgi:trehalose 6-phosphate synthase
MHLALTMPAPERKDRHTALVEKVFRTTAGAYCKTFIDALNLVKAQSVPRAAA